MPGMVGGFLRRDTNYLNINYKYFDIYKEIFAQGNIIMGRIIQYVIIQRNNGRRTDE